MIDVIIPAYHAEKFLARCICSLASQVLARLLNVYVIVDEPKNEKYSKIEDGLKTALSDTFKSLTIEYNEVNRGVGYCRSRAMDMSSDKWVYFLDSDDYMSSPYSMVYLLQAVHKNKNAKMVYANITGEFADITKKVNGNYPDISVATTVNPCGNILYLHGKLYSRRAIDDIGLKFIDVRSNEDIAFNIGFFNMYQAKGDIVRISENVAITNYNVNSITRSKNSTRSCRIANANEIMDNYIAMKATFEAMLEYNRRKGYLPTPNKFIYFIDSYINQQYKIHTLFGVDEKYENEEELKLCEMILHLFYRDIICPILKYASSNFSLKNQWFHNDSFDWAFKQGAIDLEEVSIKAAQEYDQEEFDRLAKKYFTNKGYTE